MIFVAIAALLCVATAYSLRPNVLGQGSIALTGFNGVSVVIGFVFYIAVATLIGPEFSASVIATLLLHELGQVLAHRMLGHTGARFRLVPLFNRSPISDQAPTSDGEEFFLAIMGSVFCLGPLVLAATIGAMFAPFSPAAEQQFWIFAITVGAVNFVLLLPFSPLPGGRCSRTAMSHYWPSLTPVMTACMAAAMFTASLRTGSVALMVMAGVGAHSLWKNAPSDRTALPPDASLIALAAYAFTLAAHFSIGRYFFEAYF